MTLIEIQEQYIATLNAGIRRWSHRKGIRGCGTGIGGHADRIARGAYTKAEKQLVRLGYTHPQIHQIIRDAWDVAELERRAE